MLPGDFIAMKLTGEVTTSSSALSEGVFWDFQNDTLSDDVINYFNFDSSFIPKVNPVFSAHGYLQNSIAESLGLPKGIPVTYKAGDQPNNALSLNVLQPGEVAATAGTSGVIYGVSDQLAYDKQSRVNTFAHVNHESDEKRLGVLLCINGTGILNRWVRDNMAPEMSYAQINTEAAKIPAGSGGLKVLPFGNGAERMLNNKIIGAHFVGIDLNLHHRAHIFRASQEGIAFAFRYGLDIMRENGMNPTIIRAGRSNMFLSPLFTEAFVNATGVPVELYESDGSIGAALGAGIGAKAFANEQDAFSQMKPLQLVQPDNQDLYNDLYQDWRKVLEMYLSEP
jgi:xylulokinase